MRLYGERITLLPCPRDVATAVAQHTDPTPALGAIGLRADPGWPHEDSADALRPLAEHGQPDHEGTFLVALGDAVVGDCGWTGGPDPDGTVEIAFGLARSARGHGLGTEAVAVLASWAQSRPGVRRLRAEVLVGNAPSRRLLARLGFQEVPSTPPYVGYQRAAADWTPPER